MPSQEQIDQEAGGSDLAARVAYLEDTIATLRRNLLEPAMTRPGLLRYGGNVMQLDQNGGQINAPNSATDGQGRVGIWFLPYFSPNPGNKSSSTSVFPRSNLTGYADDSTDVTRAFLVSNGKYNVTEGLVATYADQTISAVNLQAGTVSGGGTTLTGLFTLQADAADVTAARATLYDAFLNFATVTATFANPAEGDFWYDTTANVFKGRNNASTVTFGAGVATDTIWDAKGDLAVGTGADTASKLAVGSDGQVLFADSSTATGLKWQHVLGAGTNTNGGSVALDFTKGYIRGASLSSNSTITLPQFTGAAAELGKMITVKRADTSGFTMSVSPYSGQTIDGSSAARNFGPYDAMTFMAPPTASGTDWGIV